MTTALITGSTYGIGREVSNQLGNLGFDLHLLGRSREKGEKAIRDLRSSFPDQTFRYHQIDLSDFASVRSFVNQFEDRIDVLINNAGVFLSTLQHNEQGIEKTFVTNHLGHFLLTNLLIDKQESITRIINTSSAVHENASFDFDDYNRKNGYNGMKVYGETKLCNLYFTYLLGEKLKPKGIDVNAVHPGFVASRFGKQNNLFYKVLLTLLRPMMINVRKGADTITYLASDPAVRGTTGKYFVKRKAVASSPISHDMDLAEQLWKLSEQLVS